MQRTGCSNSACYAASLWNCSLQAPMFRYRWVCNSAFRSHRASNLNLKPSGLQVLRGLGLRISLLAVNIYTLVPSCLQPQPLSFECLQVLLRSNMLRGSTLEVLAVNTYVPLPSYLQPQTLRYVCRCCESTRPVRRTRCISRGGTCCAAIGCCRATSGV